MQNAFSFAAMADALKGSTADRAGSGVRAKTGDAAQESCETGVFASFLSAWAQAIGQLETDETLTTGSLDLTFSAEQGEEREERTASLPLGTVKDTLLLSQSVLDLVVSMRTELENRGIDVDLLAEQAGISEDLLPGMDMDRLNAMLSRLQSRYPITMKSDGDRHLDIEVALPDDLVLGLEASLSNLRNDGLLRKNGMGVESDVPVLPEPDAGVSEEAAPTPFVTSRLYAYLKPETPRSVAVPKAELPEEKKKAPAGRNEEESVVERTGQTGIATALPVSGQEMPQETSRDKTGEGGEENTPRPAAKSRAESAGVPSKAEEKDGNPGQKTAPASERKSGFEQFFEGATARNNRAEVRPEPMDLAKDGSLSKNETLREGLDNVVRFIRTGGSQKASVIIDPPALGRISVELTGGSAGLEASIKVSSEQVRQLVQDQIVQLRISLAQQGVQLTHFSVDVRQDSGQQHQGARRQTEGRRSIRGISGEDDPDGAQDEQTIFRVDLNQGLLWWIA